MSSQFKQIPQTLQGKVIAITAIEPGAGKSYSKIDRVKKLRADGYKVRSLGTTQIVSQDQTLCSYLRLYDNKTNEFKKYINNRKLHPKTSAFIFIDEAWMLSQEYIDALKEDFPKSCFIIIGDPSQLEGVDTSTNGQSVINKVDVNIELTGSHRTSDKRLLDFMHELKSGRINFDLLKTRIRDAKYDDLVITYTHDDKNLYNDCVNYFKATDEGKYFYSMKGEFSRGKLIFHKADKQWTDSWKNMELWRVDANTIDEFSLTSLTDNSRTISNLPFTLFKRYFYNASAVNIHKIQGISLKNTPISIFPFSANFQGSYLSILRQLYVMVSRASSWDNVSISEFAYNKLYRIFHNHFSAPLNFSIVSKVKFRSTSEELCNLNNDDFIKLLQYTSIASSPTGVINVVSLFTKCYNVSGITQTYDISKTTQTCTNTTFIGTRKSGGRGHKSTSGLNRSQRDAIVKYLCRNNGNFESNWDKSQIEYATNYINNHKEKFTNMQIFDKYDEVINNDINKVDLIKGNKQYGNYILNLEKQYNLIMGDLVDSLQKDIPTSSNTDDLIAYLNTYSGRKGLHIVYVYENFNINLAKNILKNLHPEFMIDSNNVVHLHK